MIAIQVVNIELAGMFDGGCAFGSLAVILLESHELSSWFDSLRSLDSETALAIFGSLLAIGTVAAPRDTSLLATRPDGDISTLGTESCSLVWIDF